MAVGLRWRASAAALAQVGHLLTAKKTSLIFYSIRQIVKQTKISEFLVVFIYLFVNIAFYTFLYSFENFT